MKKAKPEADPSPAPHGEFLIVGIGASAGGLAAFEAFLSGMPEAGDTGMAFVLVQHLDPDHKSLLTDLIQRCTRMRVVEITDGLAVQPDCVYIIPPGRDLAFLNGSLQLLEPAAPRGQRLPIDFFFRSLALDLRERAIGIVLSGTGSDGTLGLRSIKGEGGMVMVQSVDTCEYDGMAASAIATGLVDYQLPATEMAAQLLAYRAFMQGLSPRPEPEPSVKTENALKKIFILLRSGTGHDFSQYKPSTIRRRIERRMAIQQVSDIDGYVKYLQQTPGEVEALFRDLLIGVTNFFRDPDAFEFLGAQGLHKLFGRKPNGSTIRIWSTGCSTGEEAYSLAILLQEAMEQRQKSYGVQIFATDIDSRAIATARTGEYPPSIAADVSPERLGRYFTASPKLADGSPGSYRIRKDIRDMLVFSEHDLAKDPPFSKMDLIVCRNLLIYMGADLQKRLMPLFHFALNPGGLLFLGSSETTGDFANLFTVLDRTAKVYARKDGHQSDPREVQDHFLPARTALQVALPQARKKADFPLRLPLRELTEQAILRQVAPACATVNAQGDILYLHGRTGQYLEPPSGEVGTPNILKMAREGLRRELTTALHRAVETKASSDYPGLSVRTNGHFTRVNLSVHPILPDSTLAVDTPLYLVIMGDSPQDADASAAAPAKALRDSDGQADAETRITALRSELLANEEYLQAANEQLNSANEELKSANEEMQSVNEELQSTNEEMETSKEELQSVNEELATVNVELQTKVNDLSRANNDMNNLLAGTGIATIFVNEELKIMRFTPYATQVINLIQSDLGRPIGHTVSRLRSYTALAADIRQVLDTLQNQEREVQNELGNWFTMRILPYRTIENRVEGAVLTFVDITLAKQSREALQETQTLLQAALDNSQIGIAIADVPSGKIRYANDAGLRIRGGERSALVDGVGLEQYVAAWDLHDLDGSPLPLDQVPLARTVLYGESRKREFIIRRSDREDRIVRAESTPVHDGHGGISAAFVVFMDITDQKRAEATLRRSEEQFRRLVGDMQTGVLLQGPQAEILLCNPKALDYLGLTESQLLGKTSFDPDWNVIHEDGSAFPGETHPVPRAILRRQPVLGVVMGVYRPALADRIWLSVDAIPQMNDNGTVRQVICTFTDISERKSAEEKLRQANDLMRLAVVVRDARDAITVQDLRGNMIAWNPGASRIYGWTEAEALRLQAHDRIPAKLQGKELARLVRLSQSEILQPYRTQRLTRDGLTLSVSVTATALVDEAGEIYAIATTERLVKARPAPATGGHHG